MELPTPAHTFISPLAGDQVRRQLTAQDHEDQDPVTQVRLADPAGTARPARQRARLPGPTRGTPPLKSRPARCCAANATPSPTPTSGTARSTSTRASTPTAACSRCCCSSASGTRPTTCRFPDCKDVWVVNWTSDPLCRRFFDCGFPSRVSTFSLNYAGGGYLSAGGLTASITRVAGRVSSWVRYSNLIMLNRR